MAKLPTIKPDEDGNVLMYGHTIAIEKGATTQVIFGTEYAIEGAKKKKSKSEERREAVQDTPTTDESEA